MNHPPPPPAYAPPPKKSGNGCLIALAILFAVVLGGAALMALGVYVFATSKQGKEVIQIVGQGAKAVGESAKVLEEAARAPGTSEVRALGCRQALAIDMDRLLKAMDQFDAGLGSRGPAPVPIMVMCTVDVLATPPDCATVARAYLSGAGRPRGDFAVMVSVEHSKNQRCAEHYAPDGTKRGGFTGSAPAIPAAP